MPHADSFAHLRIAFLLKSFKQSHYGCREVPAPSFAYSAFLQALGLQISAPLWVHFLHVYGSCGW